jgi:hypothetical protein
VCKRRAVKPGEATEVNCAMGTHPQARKMAGSCGATGKACSDRFHENREAIWLKNSDAEI